jgi:hypothetical protein
LLEPPTEGDLPGPTGSRVRLEESLQDGGNAPPVLVGVPEQLGREEDVVRVELP